MKAILPRLALGYLIALSLLCLTVEWWSPYNFATHGPESFAPPSFTHWLGTDIHGRDQLTRILHGARISLVVGFVGAGVSLLIGTVVGMLSGYVGGKLDQFLMRLVDILAATPRIVIVILVMAIADQPVKKTFDAMGWTAAGDWSRLILLFAVLGAVEWMTMARIVRGQVLSLKTREFVLAARCLGQSPLGILWKHLRPNLTGLILVYLTLTIPAIILEETFLSFLGLGVQAPQASWGTLLADGAAQINPVEIYWWLLIGPASAMVITLLALNFLGDALRDHWSPENMSQQGKSRLGSKKIFSMFT